MVAVLCADGVLSWDFDCALCFELGDVVLWLGTGRFMLGAYLEVARASSGCSS